MYFSTILLSAGMLFALPDTLQDAVVVADKGLIVSKTDTLSLNPGTTITETLRQSVGLYVGETGGAAGQKTVNLRGLGSAHTTIYVDGVRVGNVQSGQVDLGNLGAGAFSGAVIDYAQNSISFLTQKPDFEYGRSVSGQVSLSAGSFGTWNPYGRVDFKLGSRTSLSATAAGLVSKGNFKFGEGLERENNDIRQVSGGLDAFGLLLKGRWHAKVHYNGSDRGTPGSLSWPSTDRQKDKNVYAQGYVDTRISCLYSLTASAKYAFDRMDYLSQWGDSRYDQSEVQVNTAHKFSVTKRLNLSLAADFTWDRLVSAEYKAERYSPTAVLGASFRSDRFKADISAEYRGAIDKDGVSRNTLSPSADIGFTILDGLDISAFGRRAYRVPTFNELYYLGYGNPNLKPEDAFLSGCGLTFRKVVGHWTVRSSADAFLNLLEDKIVSAPTQADPYVWLPYNIGKVRSLGADLAAGFDFAKERWTVSVNARYGFQSATDRTADSESYGNQIPYIARHIAFINASAAFKGWKLEAAWNLHAGLRDGTGETPDWNTLGATLSKEIRFRGCGPLSIYICGKNLMNCRYESVSGYPMPGRSLTGGFIFKF